MNWMQRRAARTGWMRPSAVRELLRVATRPGVISFAGGLPATRLFPTEAIQAAADSVLRTQGSLALQYGETEGVGALRDRIAARYSRPSLPLDRSHVLMTTGSQQGLDLIGRVFLNQGDRFLVEQPTYLALLSAWRAFGAEPETAACDEHGLIVEGLPADPGPRTKLLYTIPNFQNPRGISLAADRRPRIVRWLRDHDLGCVEDDAYGDLRYEANSVDSLFHLGARHGPGGGLECPVLYTGTFSKVLSPGLRVGWVIGPENVIQQLALAKQSVDLHTSTFSQYIILELLRQGVLEDTLPRIRDAYRERRDTMLDALTLHLGGVAQWTRPEGGIFLWLQLEDNLDANQVLHHALNRQVAFVTGNHFFASGEGRNALRLNFSNAEPEQIDEGIRRLSEAVQEARRHRVAG